MNSFAKFQTKIQANAGNSRQNPVLNERNSIECLDRILTVNIQTMRRHGRDEKNFNNTRTLLEVYGKFHLNHAINIDANDEN